jgi:light-regulated signal transduction histidine kinase (bacteriophytochrome)
LQAFNSTVVVTGLVLYAVLDERRRTADRLHRAHDEMEKFVYVAAHDLQEPLRTVTNFTELLRHGHADKLAGEARELFGFIVDGVARMRRILSDLLAFSQVDQRAAARTAVDCEKLLASVLQGLGAALREAGGTVTHDSLPPVTADATLLELLFQNLVGNAIKFRGEAPLKVRVAARRAGGYWEFSVTDNGIGIDPGHFGMIFDMFQRLHGADRYSGTGIGLTICKSIVERHNGRIWLESKIGTGTTFYFTIPEQ